MSYALIRLQRAYDAKTAEFQNGNSANAHTDWLDVDAVNAFAAKHSLPAPTWPDVAAYMLGCRTTGTCSKLMDAVNAENKARNEVFSEKAQRATAALVAAQDRLIYNSTEAEAVPAVVAEFVKSLEDIFGPTTKCKKKSTNLSLFGETILPLSQAISCEAASY